MLLVHITVTHKVLFVSKVFFFLFLKIFKIVLFLPCIFYYIYMTICNLNCDRVKQFFHLIFPLIKMSYSLISGDLTTQDHISQCDYQQSMNIYTLLTNNLRCCYMYKPHNLVIFILSSFKIVKIVQLHIVYKISLTIFKAGFCCYLKF